MNFVQPIRDPRKLQALKDHFQATNERDYILLMVGINTGLRISDILPLKVRQVRGTHIDIREKKTGKQKLIKINRALREALDTYIKGKPDHEYLFKSRNKKHKSGLINEPIDTSMAYKILSSAARRFGIAEIGTHSLRKTFGYHFYQREKDVALLMDLFNHTEQKVTLRYIGVNQDTMDDALDRFEL
ncbi:MAG: integrase [Bacilli bacterium]|nr:integrase [Bacilli bacterium]